MAKNRISKQLPNQLVWLPINPLALLESHGAQKWDTPRHLGWGIVCFRLRRTFFRAPGSFGTTPAGRAGNVLDVRWKNLLLFVWNNQMVFFERDWISRHIMPYHALLFSKVATSLDSHILWGNSTSTHIMWAIVMLGFIWFFWRMVIQINFPMFSKTTIWFWLA